MLGKVSRRLSLGAVQTWLILLAVLKAVPTSQSECTGDSCRLPDENLHGVEFDSSRRNRQHTGIRFEVLSSDSTFDPSSCFQIESTDSSSLSRSDKVRSCCNTSCSSDQSFRATRRRGELFLLLSSTASLRLTLLLLTAARVRNCSIRTSTHSSLLCETTAATGELSFLRCED